MAMQVLESARTTRRWTVLARSVLFVLICAVVLAVVSPLTAKMPGQWLPLVSGALASVVAFALTALFVRWDGLDLKAVGAAFGRLSFLRFAGGFLIGLGLVVVYTLSMIPGGHVHFVRAQTFDAETILLMLAGYLALSCREELAFHGYALRRLENRFGLWTAQLVIAALFALEHVVGGVSWMHSIFGAAVGSLLFGMAAVATRGLAVPIGVHAAWNFGQWALGEKGSSGIWKMNVAAGFEGQVETAASICYVVLMMAAALGFWMLWRRNFRGAIAAGR